MLRGFHLLALLLAVHYSHSGEWLEVKKPVLFEPTIPVKKNKLPILSDGSVFDQVNPSLINSKPFVQYLKLSERPGNIPVVSQIERGSVLPSETPIDGFLGLTGEELNKPGFIFNIQRNPIRYRIPGQDLPFQFGLPQHPFIPQLSENGLFRSEGINSMTPFDKLFTGGEKYTNPLDFSEIIPPYAPIHFLSPNKINPSPFLSTHSKLPLLSPLSGFPLDTSFSHTNPLHNNFYTTILDYILTDSFIKKSKVSGTYNAPESILEMLQTHGFNSELLHRDPYVRHILKLFEPLSSNEIFLSDLEYDKFHKLLNEIIVEGDDFDTNAVIQMPRFKLALDTIHKLLGQSNSSWDNKRLNYLVKNIIKLYGKDAFSLLKEPYTWYLLSLLSSERQGVYYPSVDYNTVFKTLNDLVNANGIHSRDILRNPFITYIVNSLRNSERFASSADRDYDRLHKSLDEILGNQELNSEAILKQPNIWNVINSLYGLHGNDKFPRTDNKAYRFYLDYLIKTYGKLARNILMEPYTWYVLSFLCKVPNGEIPIKEVDYKTIFTTLNDLINNDGLRGEIILQHPYIKTSLETLKRFDLMHLNQGLHFSVPTGFLSQDTYKELLLKLDEIVEVDDFYAESLSQDPQVWNVIKKLRKYASDDALPESRKKSLKHLLTYLIETYGRRSQIVLKEPYAWYILSLLSQRSNIEHYSGADFKKVIQILYESIIDQTAQPEDIFKHPYISQIVKLLHRPKALFEPIVSHNMLLDNERPSFKIDYRELRRTLKDVLDTTSLNTDLIFNEPLLRKIIDTIGRSFNDQDVTNFDKSSFDYYLKYVLKTYGKSAEEMLKEPYVWYIMSLLCKGPVEGFLPQGVDHKILFSTLNDLINTDGQQGESILKHPYVSYVLDSLHFNPKIISLTNHPNILPSYQQYPFRINFKYLHKTLSDVLESSHMNEDNIRENPMIWFVINSMHRSFGVVGSPYFTRNSMNGYLNYVLKSFGKGAKLMLSEPSTWYIMSLMSQGPFIDYLPLDVDYQKVFSVIYNLVNTEEKHDEDILKHPYIQHVINRLRRPLEFSTALNITPSFSNLASIPLTGANISPTEYEVFHNTLRDIITRSGLKPEYILKETAIWDLMNSIFIRSNIIYGTSDSADSVDRESLEYYLTYIIKSYGKSAEQILEEPYTWYILRLMSGGPIERFLPSHIDYTEVFRTLHNLINTEDKHYRGIIQHPYIMNTVGSLIDSYRFPMSSSPVDYINHFIYPGVERGSFHLYSTPIEYNLHQRKLSEIIDRTGLDPHTIIKDFDLWNIFNAFQNYDQGFRFSELNNESLTYYLKYIINTFGSRATNILREPYAWYILRLMSGGPIETYLPRDVNYQRVFYTLDQLINTDRKSADNILKEPYISYTVNSLRQKRDITSTIAPSYPSNYYKVYPSVSEYNVTRKKLIDIIDSRALNAETILNDKELTEIVNNFHLYDGSFEYQEFDYDNMKYFLRHILNTFGDKSERMIKEPYTWYIMKLMSANSPLGLDYKIVFNVLNNLINKEGLQGEYIFQHPYISSIINSLRHPRNSPFLQTYLPQMFSSSFSLPPIAQRNFNYYFSPSEYDQYHNKLINIIKGSGLQPDNILKEPSLWNVLSSFQQHDRIKYPFLSKDTLKYYLSYIINKYKNGAENILKEPYTWYIMRQMSGGPPESYLPYGVDYDRVFTTLNGLINIEGKNGRNIIQHPLISNVLNSLSHPSGIPFPLAPLPSLVNSQYPLPSSYNANDYYSIQPTLTEYNEYYRRLAGVIERCGLNSDNIINDPDLWNMINTIQKHNADFTLPVQKERLKYYLNYILNNYENNAISMLKEPYTWTIMNLMSRGPPETYLPLDINYQQVFSTLNRLINFDGLHAQELLRHPYISHTINSLRRPRSAFYKPSSETSPLSPFTTFNNNYKWPVDYTAYHRKLNGILAQSGLIPEAILKESDLLEIVNSIRQSRGDSGFPLMDKKMITTFLNFIIENFGNNAETTLKEPYTWYLLSLLSQSQINGDLPVGIDYPTILTKLNNLITTDGLHGEEIVNQPYMWDLVNLLRHSYGNKLYTSDFNDKPFNNLLEELIKTRGTNDEKLLRSHYIRYVINALQHSLGDSPPPSINYHIFNNLLKHLIQTYGENSEDILKDPYTWYILSLLSDGSISHLTKNGALPAGVDYRTFHNLLKYLIWTQGKKAEEKLNDPSIWYIINTLKAGSTPIKYGENINQVEELVNLDGAQYLVHSTLNRTWHPTLSQLSQPETEVYLQDGIENENKLFAIINAVIHGITTGQGNHLEVLPGGQVMIAGFKYSSPSNQIILSDSHVGNNAGGSLHIVTPHHNNDGSVIVTQGGERQSNAGAIIVSNPHASAPSGITVVSNEGGGNSGQTITLVNGGDGGGSSVTVLGGGSGGITVVGGSGDGGGSGGGIRGGNRGETVTLVGGGSEGGSSGGSTVTLLGGEGGGNLGGSNVQVFGGGGEGSGGGSSVTLLGGGGGNVGGSTVHVFGGKGGGGGVGGGGGSSVTFLEGEGGGNLGGSNVQVFGGGEEGSGGGREGSGGGGSVTLLGGGGGNVGGRTVHVFGGGGGGGGGGGSSVTFLGGEGGGNVGGSTVHIFRGGGGGGGGGNTVTVLGREGGGNGNNGASFINLGSKSNEGGLNFVDGTTFTETSRSNDGQISNIIKSVTSDISDIIG